MSGRGRVVRGEFGRGERSKPRARSAVSMSPEMGEHEYQASEFFIPSKDSQGHSVRLTFMVTPDVKRLILTILGRGVIPLWETEGDVLRWCVHHGLQAIEKRVKDPSISSAHAVTASWRALQQELVESNYWGGVLFPDLRRRLALYTKKGDFIPALKLLKVVERMVDKIGDDYWREKFKTELVDCYQYVKVKAKIQAKKLRRAREERREE